MSLTRDALIKKAPRVIRDFTFPADYPEGFAGEKFYVLRLTAKERSAFESQFSSKGGKPLPARQRQVRQRLTLATLCDEAGTLIMSPADLEAISDQDGVILEFISAAATEVNRISETDLEELAKN